VWSSVGGPERRFTWMLAAQWQWPFDGRLNGPVINQEDGQFRRRDVAEIAVSLRFMDGDARNLLIGDAVCGLAHLARQTIIGWIAIW